MVRLDRSHKIRVDFIVIEGIRIEPETIITMRSNHTRLNHKSQSAFHLLEHVSS
jgi:hypothetical protein